MPSALRDLQGMMNADFCPWANKYVYWLKKPIGWVFFALLASVLLGIYVSTQAFLVSAAISAIGIIGILWPWIAMQGVQGTLSWSRGRCEEGESIDTILTLINRWPWPAFGLFIEADHAIASQTSAPDEPICLSSVPALAESQFEWECTPGDRGLYPKRKVRLATAFPFGVWTCYRELAVQSPLVVWPRTAKLKDVPDVTGAPSAGIGTPSDQIGDEGDWMGVRPYRPGDSLRQVHWAQTARRENLVVFERQTRARPELLLWFDFECCEGCSEEEVNELLRLFATLSNHFVSHSWITRVAWNNKIRVLLPGSSTKQRWMDELASWMPDNITYRPVVPSQTTGLALGVTTDLRLATLSQTSTYGQMHWFAYPLLDESATQLDGMNSTVLRGEGYILERLERVWPHFCQHTSSASLVLSGIRR